MCSFPRYLWEFFDILLQKALVKSVYISSLLVTHLIYTFWFQPIFDVDVYILN